MNVTMIVPKAECAKSYNRPGDDLPARDGRGLWGRFHSRRPFEAGGGPFRTLKGTMRGPRDATRPVALARLRRRPERDAFGLSRTRGAG